jgi:Tfp pilus assembly protein FimT
MRVPSPLTLAEFLLVVAIVGIVAAVALPTLVGAQARPPEAAVARP